MDKRIRKRRRDLWPESASWIRPLDSTPPISIDGAEGASPDFTVSALKLLELINAAQDQMCAPLFIASAACFE